MKVASWIVCASLLVGTAGIADAGPNVRGFLTFHTDDSVIYTSDDEPYCMPSGLDCPVDFDYTDNGGGYEYEDQCQASLLNINPTSGLGIAPAVGWVIAAFLPNNSQDMAEPRLTGVTFGMSWSGNDLTIVSHGGCGDFQLDEPSWPDTPFSGTAVTWSSAKTTQATSVYWIAAYSYYGPLEVELIAHPTQGGKFADDSVPAVLDDIEEYGTLGLNGATGFDPYVPATPTIETSWGEVKALFGRED